MTSEPSRRRSPARLLVLLSVVAAGAVAFWLLRDVLTFESLAARESDLRALRHSRPVLVFLTAFAVYVLVTGLSLPGATVLTLTFAWYFGFLPAVLLVSLASTSGATLAFLLSRYLFRDTMLRRFGDRLEKFNAALATEGPFYLFTMRLIPAFPFFVINVVMGLTPIRTRTFWWVSQLGMLPGTAVYVYAGSRFPDLQTLARDGAGGILTWDLLLAFALLGLFPVVVRRLLKSRTRPADQTTVPADPANPAGSSAADSGQSTQGNHQ